MGDHTTETPQQFEKRCNEFYARDQFLGNKYLELTKDSTCWILNHIDCFVSQCRGNKIVIEVCFYPYSVDGYDDDVWDKLGRAIGNLQALKSLSISYENFRDESDTSSDEDDDDEDVPIPDWEILAQILTHVRQNVRVAIHDERLRTLEEVQPFARAIRGHPTITSFQDIGMFPYESLETLFSTLSTLSAIESVSFGAPEVMQVNESTLAHPESLTELLRVPTLRIVRFNKFSFTPALFQATANALMEGTAVTKLEFIECSFSAVECDIIMAKGLSRNTSVISITVQCINARAVYDALTVALPSNSTLRHLELQFCQQDDDNPDCFAPVFSALGQNTALKSIKICIHGSTEESLRTAINDGLSMNETLESLELANAPLSDDNADSWRRALSFLRTNKALKSLVCDVRYGVTESCLSTFRCDIACMLQDNTSLESISIHSWSILIKAEEYVALIAALQHNRTLKTLLLQPRFTIQLADDEDKEISSLLKKNYALESLPNINLKNRVTDVGATLRLNAAGRRYLVQDGSSISKGVQVLSRVNNDLNCVFLHLLENPRLCDRRAGEMVTGVGESNGRSRNPNSTSG